VSSLEAPAPVFCAAWVAALLVARSSLLVFPGSCHFSFSILIADYYTIAASASGKANAVKRIGKMRANPSDPFNPWSIL